MNGDISVSWLLSTVHPAPPPTQLRFGARDLTFLGALFLHSIVERLLHGLRRDYWRSLWTRSRERKGKGGGLAASAQSLGAVVFPLQCNC